MPKDSCYHSVKSSYDVFPSARASQAIAKCRKGKGSVRKTSKGSSLKRWQKEKWTDTKSGKPCGAGGSNEYCRPKRKVSSKTPKTAGEIGKSKLAQKKAEKSRVGMGNRVTSLSSLNELMEFGVRKERLKAIAETIKKRGFKKQPHETKKHITHGQAWEKGKRGGAHTPIEPAMTPRYRYKMKSQQARQAKNHQRAEHTNTKNNPYPMVLKGSKSADTRFLNKHQRESLKVIGGYPKG